MAQTANTFAGTSGRTSTLGPKHAIWKDVQVLINDSCELTAKGADITVNKPSNASCRVVADEADDNATPRSPRVDSLNKGASDLPLVISGVGCDTEEAEALKHDASSTPATTTIFRRFGSAGPPQNWGVPPAWRPFKENQLLPHHSAINQLDNTIPIAPRPPSSLTTELEPRIQSPSNKQSQITAADCTVPPTILTTPPRLHPDRQAA